MVGGHPGRGRRIRPGPPPAVGQQNDRGRGVRSRRDRFELLLLLLGFAIDGGAARIGTRKRTPENRRLKIDPPVRKDRRQRKDDAAANSRVALHLESADRRAQVLATW